jgi:uncharacterized protein (DUF302 family)
MTGISAARIFAGLIIGVALSVGTPTIVKAQMASPYSDLIAQKTSHSYPVLVEKLNKAVKNNKMGLVTRASATMGAKSLGVKIAGNMVIGVYNPHFAIRMLKASVPAGIEAPLRFYITENADGTASLSYRKPSGVFGAYKIKALDEMAKELDAIFVRIAAEATR